MIENLSNPDAFREGRREGAIHTTKHGDRESADVFCKQGLGFTNKVRDFHGAHGSCTLRDGLDEFITSEEKLEAFFEMQSPSFPNGVGDVLEDWDQLCGWRFKEVEILLDQEERGVFPFEVTLGEEALDHGATGFLCGIAEDEWVLTLARDDDVTGAFEGFLSTFPPLFVVSFGNDVRLEQAFELVERHLTA